MLKVVPMLKGIFEALKEFATDENTTSNITSIILSLITGIISGLVVSAIWQRHMHKIEEDMRDENSKTEYVKQFRDDIQTFCHYLERVRVELDLPDNEDKSSNIIRVIALRPMTHSFSSMTEDGLSIIHDIDVCLNELKVAAKSKSINCYNFNFRIFESEMKLLENQRKIMKPWVKKPKKDATKKSTAEKGTTKNGTTKKSATKKSTAEKGTTKKIATKKGAADMDAK